MKNKIDMENYLAERCIEHLNTLDPKIIEILEKLDTCYIYGGTLRRLALGEKITNDVDLDVVVYGEGAELKLIRAGELYSIGNSGYLIKLQKNIEGKELDIWDVQSTYQFGQGIYDYQEALTPYQNLFRTARFGVDQAVFDYATGTVHISDNFHENINSRILRLVSSHNMWPRGMIAKAIELQYEYGFQFSEDLTYWMLRALRGDK